MEALRGVEGRRAWRCFALLQPPGRQQVKRTTQQALAAAKSLRVQFPHNADSGTASLGSTAPLRSVLPVQGDLRAAKVMVRLPDGDAAPQKRNVCFADFDWSLQLGRLGGWGRRGAASSFQRLQGCAADWRPGT